MKNIIRVSLGLVLLPLLSLAAVSTSVSPVEIQKAGHQPLTFTGSSVYDETFTTTSATLDGADLGGTDATSWSFSSERIAPGEHTITSKVDGVTSSVSFKIKVLEGGFNPCQTEGTCPNFGLFAPQIPNQNEKPKFLHLEPGQGECPVWFPRSGCTVRL